MTDIVERLRDYAQDDHKRGCQGRCYSCECGYDDKRDPLLVEAADEIERLREALQESKEENAKLRRALIESAAQVEQLWARIRALEHKTGES